MRSMKKVVLTLALAFVAANLGACTTVTIRDRGMQKIESDPNYSSSEPIFFWGLVGSGKVNVTEVCGTKRPVQLQSQQTFVDGLLRGLTLGIYSPRTAKVWCTEQGGSSL